MADKASPPLPTRRTKDETYVGHSGKKHTPGLLPRLVKKFAHPSETFSSSAPTVAPKNPGRTVKASSVSSVSAPTSPQPVHIDFKAEESGRRRQRRMKSVGRREQHQKQTSKLITTPGERIFPLPSRVKPISLFIRMGSLDSEQDPVPLEYYGTSDEEDSVLLAPSITNTMTVPHPEALQTRHIFHVGEGLATASPTQTKVSQDGRRTTFPIVPISPSGLPKRPFSIQIPPSIDVMSPLRKDDDGMDERKRPRSLRFLDPKDQKLHAAVSHKDFLALLRQTEECTMRRSFEEVSLDDTNTLPSHGRSSEGSVLPPNLQSEKRPCPSRIEGSMAPGGTVGATSISDEYGASSTVHPHKESVSPPLARSWVFSAPPTLTDSMADTERSNVQDWSTSETINGDELPPVLPLRLASGSSRPRSMPILPKEHSSLESSDISGCEADSEEKHRIITNRRGSMANK